MKLRWHILAQAILVTLQSLNTGLPWKHQLTAGLIVSSIQAGLAFYAHAIDTEGNKL